MTNRTMLVEACLTLLLAITRDDDSDAAHDVIHDALSDVRHVADVVSSTSLDDEYDE